VGPTATMRREASGRARGIWLVVLVTSTVLALVLVMGRRAQDPLYHRMADTTTLLGTPNFWNVVSNIPFALAGAAGLVLVFRRRTVFVHAWDRWPYAALFIGAFLTCLGSAYYHLAPDNRTLVWDRLPMTIGFMGLLTALISERVSLTAAQRLFVPLLVLGAASVTYWHHTEQQGIGDLRPYAAVQYGSLAAIVLILCLYPSKAPGDGFLWSGLALYALAKVFENWDLAIYRFLGGTVSGHTLKHLAAAAGIGCLVVMIARRQSLSGPLRGPTDERGEVGRSSLSRKTDTPAIRPQGSR
jgi:hypothetical protein